MKSFVGKRNEQVVYVMYPLPKPPMSSGQNWGYEGGGPKRLAYDILLELYGEPIARRYHLPFEDEVIAEYGVSDGRDKDSFNLTEQDVKRWLDDYIERTCSDKRVSLERDPERFGEYQERDEQARQERHRAWKQKVQAANAALDMSLPVKVHGRPDITKLKDAIDYYGEVLPVVVGAYGQWVVTESGMDCLHTEYQIRVSDLFSDETDPNSLINHVQEKPWLEADEFRRALAAAKLFHRHRPTDLP
jgi:hypothetical protein